MQPLRAKELLSKRCRGHQREHDAGDGTSPPGGRQLPGTGPALDGDHDRERDHAADKGEEKCLFANEHLEPGQNAEQAAGERRMPTPADQDLVGEEPREGRKDGERDMQVRRVGDHCRRKAIQQSSGRRGRPAIDVASDYEERAPCRKCRAERGGKVVCDHRAQQYCHRAKQQCEQWAVAGPHQVDSGGIVEIVADQRVETMR